jgi:type IV pilus assembly protein PilV
MNFHQRRLRAQRGQRGFTMFEILVTLFLLTLWLLASAGVQSSSLKFSKAAQLRTQAINLATDLAERMQANRTGAIAGNYVVAATALTSEDIVTVDACVSALCSPSALAAFDVTEWKGRVAAALPNASVTVSTAAVANPITYTIFISWSDRRTDRKYSTTGNTESFSYTATKSVFDPPS